MHVQTKKLARKRKEERESHSLTSRERERLGWRIFEKSSTLKKRKEKRERVQRTVGCTPCRRPRAIDSRASQSLRSHGTRERGTREGIPTGEGGGEAATAAAVGPGGHARKGERERERERGRNWMDEETDRRGEVKGAT